MHLLTGGAFAASVRTPQRGVGLDGIGTGQSAAGSRWRGASARLALAALAAYAVLLWVSRPAAPFEWDEVLAQRAVLKYDPATHSPQPPGFPAYIGAAKAVNVVTGDPLVALQVVGIFWALTGLAATWALARRLGAPPAAAFAAAAVLAASPEFLYSAAVGISDVSGASACVVATLAVVAAVERPVLLPLAGAACGVVAGMRPQSGVVLVPALAWALVTAVRARRWRSLALGAMTGVVVAAASWIPAIFVTGPQRWWAATTGLVHYMATVERALRLPGAGLADIARWWLAGSFVGWQFALPLWAFVTVGTVALVRTGRGRLAALAAASVAVYLAFAVSTTNETVSLRYFMPAVPFVALLAGGALAVRGRLGRRTAATLVALWCMTAVAWTTPALIERQKPGPVWAALTWIREHYDPATTRVVFDFVAAPHVEYVLGRAGFRIVDMEKANLALDRPARPGEQTLFVTPLPVPGADLLFMARQRTRRVLQLAWERYGSCAVSRERAGTAVFSPEWQQRKDGWLLWGTGHIQLQFGAKPAIVRLCAGRETITLKRPGSAAETVAPGQCVMSPLLPGAAAALAVSGPPDSVTLVPPIQILQVSALEAGSGLASAYMVPQAAHLDGFGGAVWRTDLVLFNPQPHPLAVTAQFLPTGRDNAAAPAVSSALAPGQVLDVPDVLSLPEFRNAGTFGALLLHATAGGEACASPACNFLVLARTYNARTVPGVWRANEWMGGVAPDAALAPGETAVVRRVTRSATVVASVGAASWSEVAMRVRVRVLDSGDAVVEARELDLAPFGHLHVPLTAEVGDGKVEFEIAAPGAGVRVVPYVSMVDRGTGLPTHLLPEPQPSRTAGSGWHPSWPRIGTER